MRRRQQERGQVLPLWIFGSLTTLTLMFLAVNYANAVRYQVRAQNAADSAATGLMAIQAQRYNEMSVALYTANVEEYRLRRTLDGMMLATALSGGCQPDLDGTYLPAVGSPSPNSCDAIYQNLRFFYMKSLNRYTADVQQLNNVTSGIGQTPLTNDAASFIGQLGQGSTGCPPPPAPPPTPAPGSNVLGDCAMYYHIVNLQPRTNLLAVDQNAGNLVIPGLGYADPTHGLNTENSSLWAPLEVDITTCAKVPPLIPNFGPIHLPTTYAVGRAAATNVMVEEDWLDPGEIADPVRAASEDFQAPEKYTQSSAQASGNTGAAYDWYNVDFGGNVAYAFPQFGYFSSNLGNDELSVRLGWWNAIPIRPYEATPPSLVASTQCT